MEYFYTSTIMLNLTPSIVKCTAFTHKDLLSRSMIADKIHMIL